MNTPNNYKDVCEKALKVKQELNLSDTETLLYNHLCRKDFYLQDEDGQNFYDINNNGFGCFGSKRWVKNNLKKVVDKKLITFVSKRHDRDARRTSWYWYDAECEFDDLVNASCFVTTHKYFVLRKYLNLPEGFDRNGEYGGIKFIKKKVYKDNYNFYYDYSFIYKEKKFKYDYDNFKGLIHQIWDTIEKEDKVDLYSIETDSVTKRYFEIENDEEI